MLGQNQTKIVGLAQRFSRKLHFSDFSLLIVHYHPARFKKTLLEYLEIKVCMTVGHIHCKIAYLAQKRNFWETLFTYFFLLIVLYHATKFEKIPRVDPRYKNLHNFGQPSGQNFSFGQQKKFFWKFHLMYFYQLIVPYDAAHFEKNL